MAETGVIFNKVAQERLAKKSTQIITSILRKGGESQNTANLAIEVPSNFDLPTEIFSEYPDVLAIIKSGEPAAQDTQTSNLEDFM